MAREIRRRAQQLARTGTEAGGAVEREELSEALSRYYREKQLDEDDEPEGSAG